MIATGGATEPAWPGEKPRLLFFRVLGSPELPAFVRGHFHDQERCLAQFFDVTVVTDDADFDEQVDRAQPDLVLFESGVYARSGRSIRNTHTHPDIPRLGFLHSDGYCLSRSVFLADMEDWGVDTYFAYAMSAVGYTPDIADRTYLWPNFADRSVFRSYPGGKTETILLSGSREPNYPWRVGVHRLLAERFPARSIAHGGWFDKRAAAAMPVGADYARSLSGALIVPTCGTIAEEFVRKYVEIPAAGAVLLAERTPIAEAAGFVDGENCVFADESDVVAKVEHLLDNPDELDRIAAAGQQLAHSRHSIEHRDQLRQWFELHRTAAPGQRIVQPDAFGPLQLTEAAPVDRPVVSVALPPGRDRRLIAEGRRLLADGRAAAAAEAFAEVLNLHYEPEAALGLARSWLRLGRVAEARALLEHATGVGVAAHGASHPDPVEQAWLLRALLADGDLTAAVALADRAAGLRHPELDRMRAAVAACAGDDGIALAERPRHRSVHGAGDDLTWPDWIDRLADDLRTTAAGAAFAEHMNGLRGGPDPSTQPSAEAPPARRRPPAVADLARRALRRARWEIARRRGAAPAADRSSLFQLLGGVRVDSAVLLLVDDDTARRFEPLVLRSPDPIGFVRLGRTAPPATAGFTPLGLRWGADAGLLRRVCADGRAVVVASAIGAALVEPAALAGAAVLVVLDDADQGLAPAPSWREDDELRDGFARALGADRLRVWVRVDGAEADRG